jgi:phenylpyruvate tautomerase PptA (4-oxalocrotonate tautomerase family)
VELAEGFMPLVRIDLREGKSPDYRVAIGEVIYDALLSIGVPANDRFQVITEHPKDCLVFDPGYLGIERSDAFIMIQITLNEGRSLELKKRLYSTIADQLNSRLSLRREDVFINLVEVKKENWSFGNGEAQYAT